MDLDTAVRKLRGLSSSSPVSAMNAAESAFREASRQYVIDNNANPNNPRMEIPNAR